MVNAMVNDSKREMRKHRTGLRLQGNHLVNGPFNPCRLLTPPMGVVNGKRLPKETLKEAV